jgi:hypothetical protein
MIENVRKYFMEVKQINLYVSENIFYFGKGKLIRISLTRRLAILGRL